jgi:hypothetical protein
MIDQSESWHFLVAYSLHFVRKFFCKIETIIAIHLCELDRCTSPKFFPTSLTIFTKIRPWVEYGVDKLKELSTVVWIKLLLVIRVYCSLQKRKEIATMWGGNLLKRTSRMWLATRRHRNVIRRKDEARHCLLKNDARKKTLNDLLIPTTSRHLLRVLKKSKLQKVR